MWSSLFFFSSQEKKDQEGRGHREGKIQREEEALFEEPCIIIPLPPLSLKPSMRRIPFPFPSFSFFSILTNKRISLISSCESQCIVFFLFFLKNQSIYGMIRHLTGLPCKALERRGLRIYAERHARRVQLFRYKFVHFL